MNASDSWMIFHTSVAKLFIASIKIVAARIPFITFINGNHLNLHNFGEVKVDTLNIERARNSITRCDKVTMFKNFMTSAYFLKKIFSLTVRKNRPV